MLKIKDLKTLRKLTTNNKEGELAIVEETRVLYRWDGGTWVAHKPEGGLKSTLYEINQTAMTGLPALSNEDIESKKELITNYCAEHAESNFFMLLNRETYDFTIFNTGQNGDTIENEVIDTLLTRGELKDISPVTDAVEFWITKDQSHSLVYYFFDYQGGVIKCQ